MNWFFEKENTGDRGREWGFSQAALTPVLLPYERLKIGIEMVYKNITSKTLAAIPRTFSSSAQLSRGSRLRTTRLDISPLFGCTGDSPVADVFVAFSWLFGGERAEAEAPVSRVPLLNRRCLQPRRIRMRKRNEAGRAGALPRIGTATTNGM